MELLFFLTQTDPTMHAARNASAATTFSPRKCLAWTLVLGILIGLSSAARAQCTSAAIRQMIQEGLSDAEIDRRCAEQPALPTWLAGSWEVTMHTKQTSVPTPLMPAPTITYWHVTVTGSTLQVQDIQDAHLPATLRQYTPLTVSDVAFDGTTLTLIVHQRNAVMDQTTRLTLNVEREDRLSGRFTSLERGTPALPPIRESGTITLLKKDLTLQPGAVHRMPSDPIPDDWPDSFCMPNCD